jgi:tetrahydromethanopterin S-methyltransferase subunit A
MLKVKPHAEYPLEEGRYIRGNDFSPVAVVIILNTDGDKIPPSLEILVRAGVESGAAISGTLQTPNIGLEKMICNIVANPNIRYLVLGGPESDGHKTGDALKALFSHGVDAQRRIIKTEAPFPSLYNISLEAIERFRKQVTLIDLQFEADPDLIKQAVRACFQEQPTSFRNYSVYDSGAYSESALGQRIVWNVTQPWVGLMTDDEKAAVKKAQELMERIRQKYSQKYSSK